MKVLMVHSIQSPIKIIYSIPVLHINAQSSTAIKNDPAIVDNPAYSTSSGPPLTDNPSYIAVNAGQATTAVLSH